MRNLIRTPLRHPQLHPHSHPLPLPTPLRPSHPHHHRHHSDSGYHHSSQSPYPYPYNLTNPLPLSSPSHSNSLPSASASSCGDRSVYRFAFRWMSKATSTSSPAASTQRVGTRTSTSISHPTLSLSPSYAAYSHSSPSESSSLNHPPNHSQVTRYAQQIQGCDGNDPAASRNTIKGNANQADAAADADGTNETHKDINPSLSSTPTTPSPSVRSHDNDNPTLDEIWPSSFSSWSGQLNHCISHHPLQTVAALFALEALSFTLSHTVLISSILPSTYTFSSTWIVAYVLSWPIRRSIIVKLTLAPFIAIPLANIIPALKRVDILNLLRNPIFMRLRGGSKEVSPPSGHNTDDKSKETGQKPRWIVWWITLLPRMLENFTRHYGVAAFISYRLVGALILALIYESLTYGIDVQKWLEKLGLDQYIGDINVHNKSAVYVVALIGSAVLFPINIFLLPYTVKYLTHPIVRGVKKLLIKQSK